AVSSFRGASPQVGNSGEDARPKTPRYSGRQRSPAGGCGFAAARGDLVTRTYGCLGNGEREVGAGRRPAGAVEGHRGRVAVTARLRRHEATRSQGPFRGRFA